MPRLESRSKRHCPRCTFLLDVVVNEGVELDHCRRCGGTFLDPGEARESFGPAASPEVWKSASLTTSLGPSPLRCPHEGAYLEAFNVEYGIQSVTVDLCPHCSGLWLDAREGQKLNEIVLQAGQSPDSGLSEFATHPGVGSYLFQLLSGFPMEVWNPVRRPPWLTYSLMAVLFALFLLSFPEVALNPGKYANWVAIPAVIFERGTWWTLLTASFFHASWLHLLGNLYFLYTFGDNVEDTLGSVRFVLLYVAAAVAGSGLQVLTQTDPNVASLGASDAIAGLMGAYFVLFPRVKVYIVFFFIRLRIAAMWYLGFWIALNLAQYLTGGGQSSGVAWMAHVGGFAAGVALGWLFKPKALVDRFKTA